MNADKKKEFLYAEESHQIIGCAFEVLNTLGHGFHEKIYENSLVVEFGLRDIPNTQQPDYEIAYKTVNVGKFIPDLIVFEKIVVDTKTIDRITENERGKMLNYLNVTNLKIGLIINFKNPKLEWLRVAR